MILLPAVDIRGGRAVRLRRGDFERETVYADDPLEAARAWVDAGARGLHVVDLDGARAGRPASMAHLERIAGLGVPVEYGGGLRSAADVRSALDAGAARAVIGTAAQSDPDLVAEVVAAHGDRVLAAVDVKAGAVAVEGWTQNSDSPAEALVERLGSQGVAGIVYTAVDRDGLLEGPDLDAAARVGALVGGELVYSGGVSSVSDLHALRDLGIERLTGVVCGKALYEGRFTVAEGQSALEGPG